VYLIFNENLLPSGWRAADEAEAATAAAHAAIATPDLDRHRMDEHMRELRVLVDYRADLIKRRTGLISDPPRKNCWMLAQHARDHTPGQDAAHCWASPPKPADPPGDPAAGPRYRLVARRRMADRYHPVEPASAAGGRLPLI